MDSDCLESVVCTRAEAGMDGVGGGGLGMVGKI